MITRSGATANNAASAVGSTATAAAISRAAATDTSPAANASAVAAHPSNCLAVSNNPTTTGTGSPVRAAIHSAMVRNPACFHTED